MFGLKPRPPLGIEEMRLLVRGGASIIALVRGVELRSLKTLLPEDSFVERSWSGAMGSVERLVAKVAARMGVEAAIEVSFHADGSPTRILEEEGRGSHADRILSVDDRLQRAPDALVASVARALSPLVLAGTSLKDEEKALLPELLPIFYGFGLYCANTVLLRKSYSLGDGVRRFSVWPQGEMPSDSIGCALALVSVWRGEEGSALGDYLDAGAASAFGRTLRFLGRNRLSVWGADGGGKALEDLSSWLIGKADSPRQLAAAHEAPAPGGNGMEKPTLDRIDVLGCGTFLGEIEAVAGEEGEAAYRLIGADLDRVTTVIPLKEGIIFGFMFRAIGSGKGGVFELRALVRRPESGGREGESRATSEARLLARDRVETAAWWSFREAGDMEPGRWTIELWDDERLLASRDFEVVAGKR